MNLALISQASSYDVNVDWHFAFAHGSCDMTSAGRTLKLVTSPRVESSSKPKQRDEIRRCPIREESGALLFWRTSRRICRAYAKHASASRCNAVAWRAITGVKLASRRRASPLPAAATLKRRVKSTRAVARVVMATGARCHGDGG